MRPQWASPGHQTHRCQRSWGWPARNPGRLQDERVYVLFATSACMHQGGKSLSASAPTDNHDNRQTIKQAGCEQLGTGIGCSTTTAAGSRSHLRLPHKSSSIRARGCQKVKHIGARREGRGASRRSVLALPWAVALDGAVRLVSCVQSSWSDRAVLVLDVAKHIAGGEDCRLGRLQCKKQP